MKHYPQIGRKLKIYFASEGEPSGIDYELKITVRRAIEATLDFECFEKDAEVSVTFCDNTYIKELNRKHRNIDRATDVLSFPIYGEDEEISEFDVEPIPLGDVVLSLERAREQAEELSHSFLREAAFLCVHSTLHLLGYDHELSEEEDELMCRKQKKIIEYLDIE
ncbi:MAG: rRNA maturation RNase YbeY [Clostridia bacterium]|nr:rRNA maturation RNase YbeY [Clostridia bacterium]